METTTFFIVYISGLYKDSGKESGNYCNPIGIHRGYMRYSLNS